MQQHDREFNLFLTKIKSDFESMVKKLNACILEVRGLRGDFAKFADHENRLKKLEDEVFRKGA